ncbi:hypothetical protein [Nocardia paucivorans]|uniref:hypothetical protein n=1 Tax=Nocardia paucivorans TaxID=114259 RepID=UPI00068754CA|nr:hypothetical protein [Nocardia paucivorans]
MRSRRGRTRWTATLPDGRTLVGYRGQIAWWVVWWLLSPLFAVLAVGMILGGGGDLPRMPRRIRRRDDGTGTIPLDYRGDVLRVVDGQWDLRFLTGLTALLGSHAGLMGSPWDTVDSLAGP